MKKLRKLIILTLSLLIILGICYGSAYATSPTIKSKFDVAAYTLGVNDQEDNMVRVSFKFDLDKEPILVKQQTVYFRWSEGWALESFNLKENGEYLNEDIISSPLDSREKIIKINSTNINDDGAGEGYFVLKSTNKHLNDDMIESSASLNFNYSSIIKNFKIADATTWKIEN